MTNAQNGNGKTLGAYLQNIIENEPGTLKAEVAGEALDYDDPKSFFTDLFYSGCISGMVGKLVYYADTRAFYDRYYHEIESLREEWEESTGEPLQIKGDLKNYLAWFGFEYTAQNMYFEWESR
ncbi:MAG: hypothetical protein AAFZ15_30480 [Bacteroidota bacterium]